MGLRYISWWDTHSLIISRTTWRSLATTMINETTLCLWVRDYGSLSIYWLLSVHLATNDIIVVLHCISLKHWMKQEKTIDNWTRDEWWRTFTTVAHREWLQYTTPHTTPYHTHTTGVVREMRKGRQRLHQQINRYSTRGMIEHVSDVLPIPESSLTAPAGTELPGIGRMIPFPGSMWFPGSRHL